MLFCSSLAKIPKFLAAERLQHFLKHSNFSDKRGGKLGNLFKKFILFNFY